LTKRKLALLERLQQGQAYGLIVTEIHHANAA
jgi:hypothetical protein